LVGNKRGSEGGREGGRGKEREQIKFGKEGESERREREEIKARRTKAR
jgi:hypothetical protein